MKNETMHQKLQRYVKARGLKYRHPHKPSGRKVLEEAGELLEAIAERDWDHAKEEVADVFFSLARQAYLIGTTIEECIEIKIALDTGRDK